MGLICISLLIVTNVLPFILHSPVQKTSYRFKQKIYIFIYFYLLFKQKRWRQSASSSLQSHSHAGVKYGDGVMKNYWEKSTFSKFSLHCATKKNWKINKQYEKYVTCSHKTRNKSHGAILRYRTLKFQREKNNLKVKYEILVFL